MIEELDDIIEEIADDIGIYGAHTELVPDVPCACRVCFTSSLKARIIAAAEVQAKLSK